MTKKTYRPDLNNNYQNLADKFEDYGYDVQNIRRQTKKKVSKFKLPKEDYYDSY